MDTKVAVLLDGGFYLKRLPFIRRDIDATNAQDVAASIGQLIDGHLRQINEVYLYPNHERLLYRCFFYDAWPYDKKAHLPISNRAIDYSKSKQAQFRNELLELLKDEQNLALRMGEVTRPGNASWILKERTQKRLLKGEISVSDLDGRRF